jgi:hypothetical protein
MRFTLGDVKGPYRFIQNRARTSVAALKSNAAAEKSKDQLSRDFPGRSILQQNLPKSDIAKIRHGMALGE